MVKLLKGVEIMPKILNYNFVCIYKFIFYKLMNLDGKLYTNHSWKSYFNPVYEASNNCC